MGHGNGIVELNPRMRIYFQERQALIYRNTVTLRKVWSLSVSDCQFSLGGLTVPIGLGHTAQRLFT